MTSLKQELKDAGNQVSDQDFILTIMNGTHEDYGDFVSAVTGKKAVDKLEVNDLIDQLIKEDDLKRTMSQREPRGTPGGTNRRVLMVKGKYSKYVNKSKNSTKNRNVTIVEYLGITLLTVKYRYLK